MSRFSTAAIELRQVSKWYGQVIGLNRVSLEITSGVTGLLGPNGSGKSTLMNLVAGQLRPSLGRVLVYGKNVWRSPATRRALGYVPEGDSFHEDMSGRQFVYSMARLSGLPRSVAKRRTAEALDSVGMSATSDKALRHCSKGMRQRVKIAQSLVHEPRLLVLDEPMQGLDPKGRKEFKELFVRLGREGRAVLLSSHILHEVEAIADRIVLLDNGQLLAAGALESIREFIAEHPLTIGITSNRREELAAGLLLRELAVEVSLDAVPSENGAAVSVASDRREGLQDWTVKVRHPERFFREFPSLVLELDIRVERMETIDASAQAVFDYLVQRA